MRWKNPQSELVWQGVRGRIARRAARALPGSLLPAPGTMQHPAGSTPPFSDLNKTWLEQNKSIVIFHIKETHQFCSTLQMCATRVRALPNPLTPHLCVDQGWKCRETCSAYKTGCIFVPLHCHDIPVNKYNTMSDIEMSLRLALSNECESLSRLFRILSWLQAFFNVGRQFHSCAFLGLWQYLCSVDSRQGKKTIVVVSQNKLQSLSCRV